MNRRDALKNTVLVLGYTVAVPSLASIFSSCNNNGSTALGWEPEVFSSSQAAILSELTETILPKTKTPGAKDLHLDQFIDKLVKQVLSPEDQEKLKKGIDAFEAESKEVNGKGFIESSSEERTKLLTKLEGESEKVTGNIWGFPLKKDPPLVPFYRQVKELTLLGYFTSQEVGKNILVYDPVPGKYIADMPLGHGHISFE